MAMEREPQLTIRNIPESQASSYNIGGAEQGGGGGIGGWISQHKVMAAVILAGVGGLAIWFFYSKANQQTATTSQSDGQSQDVSTTGNQPTGDTSGTSGGSPDTLYDAPGVLSALSGIQQTEDQILAGEKSEDGTSGTPQPGGDPGGPPVKIKKKCHSHKHTHAAGGKYTKKTTHSHRHCIPPTHHSSAEPKNPPLQEFTFNEPPTPSSTGTGGGPMPTIAQRAGGGKYHHWGSEGPVFGGYLRETHPYHTSLHMKEPHPRSTDSRSIYRFPL